MNDISDINDIIGLRNIIAHGYDVIENEILWDSVQKNVPVLMGQLKVILAE